MTEEIDVVDVVVVGAGLSGLVAARELRRTDRDVVVLEAADRCGGRSLAVTSSLGSRLDLGGQWIGADHHRLIALADELGATRYAMHTGPVPTLVDGPRRVRLASPRVLIAGAALGVLDLLRRTRGGAGRDTTTVADWLRRVPGRGRRLLEVLALVSWTADLDRISVRTMTSLIRGQGGLGHMLSTKGGAQEALIVEGAGSLVECLTEELGTTVRTGTPVTAILRDDDGVVVRTAAGELRARRVIVSVPPPMARHIRHEPPLPEARHALERESFLGTVYKAIAVYPAPFWRSTASGELIMLDHPGCAVFDTTAPGGPGHLCFLAGGPAARALDELAPDERRTALLARVAAHLGPEVLAPADWHEKSWHLDEWAGGGYIALPEAGARSGTVPMACDPVGRVHWAGAETAKDHPGYLDGAIESGQRAAREVLAALAVG